MLVRPLSLLLLFGLPAISWGQNPRPEVDQAEISPAEELQRLVTARDALTAKIDRLRKTAGLPQQVCVSVKFLELSLNEARRANLQIEGVDTKTLQPFRFAKLLFPAGQAQQVGGDVSTGAHLLENDQRLDKVLADLKKAGAVRLIAEPTVMSLSGRPAAFHSGGEFPILATQADGKTATQHRRYGTHVDITPVVLGNGKIKLDLHPEVSELDPKLNVTTNGVTVPGLRSRGIRTHIEMKSGQTYLLSGLVQQGKNKTADGEPEEIELVVIVKAEIVDPLLR
ncbi:type II and III secretion system protein family protein [Blastopirellula retiformator]|uniref:Outer membrane porin HofQ n=1 Tax=Blastopirellula retiformator TaxID=2527970 RepID=A0A5C5V9K6_9BACT|nr:hypothetical protein [Blastopirellula retiformator]TWT34603.1 outer membrane porin HofQ [Blastopirellula retiformator]